MMLPDSRSAALLPPGRDARAFRTAAGGLVLGYVAVQAFQAHVFGTFPAPASAAEELLQGAAPLHLARSSLMLVWMFALIFISWVICAQGMRRRPILAGAAFLGFFMFGLFEVALRSVELFWTQIQLPAAYLKTEDPALRAAILDKVATFQSIQHALYFPLMFAPWLGSIGVFFLFPGTPRIHWALKAGMAIAIIRTAVRLLAYAGIELMSLAFYEKIYFLLVVVEFLPKAYWLFRVGDDQG